MATEGEYRAPDADSQRDDRLADPLPALLAPSLLAGLETADDRTAHTAGYGLFLLARSTDAVPALATRVAERLVTDDGHRPARRTLASLRLLDDGAVRAALVDATDRERARRLYAAVRETDPWPPPDFLPGEGDHAEYLTAFRRVVDPAEDEESTGTTDDSPTDVIADDEPGASEDAADDGETAAPSPGQSTDESGGLSTKRDRIERLADSELVATLCHRSGFDELQVLSPVRERRYADAFRARARADDTERGVTVRLLAAEGAAGLGDHLASWAGLLAAEGVVTVVDWGTTPRPWVATECVDGRLSDRGRVGPAAALRYARRLTGALVELHQRDAVHGGIDPDNVVYAEGALGDGVRPMLDNVGLLHAYRRAADPGDYLDPRYAAPEYFDDQYGRVDGATDVYQLGMVVYRLLAGRHPFRGSYADVRDGVLEDRPPAPSECTPALPAAVDEVIAKATAKQKLTRYETATGFHQDVSRVCEAVLD